MKKLLFLLLNATILMSAYSADTSPIRKQESSQIYGGDTVTTKLVQQRVEYNTDKQRFDFNKEVFVNGMRLAKADSVTPISYITSFSGSNEEGDHPYAFNPDNMPFRTLCSVGSSLSHELWLPAYSNRKYLTIKPRFDGSATDLIIKKLPSLNTLFTITDSINLEFVPTGEKMGVWKIISAIDLSNYYTKLQVKSLVHDSLNANSSVSFVESFSGENDSEDYPYPFDGKRMPIRTKCTIGVAPANELWLPATSNRRYVTVEPFMNGGASYLLIKTLPSHAFLDTLRETTTYEYLPTSTTSGVWVKSDQFIAENYYTKQQTSNLIKDSLASHPAVDTALLVHKANAETITGVKEFTNGLKTNTVYDLDEDPMLFGNSSAGVRLINPSSGNVVLNSYLSTSIISPNGISYVTAAEDSISTSINGNRIAKQTIDSVIFYRQPYLHDSINLPYLGKTLMSDSILSKGQLTPILNSYAALNGMNYFSNLNYFQSVYTYGIYPTQNNHWPIGTLESWYQKVYTGGVTAPNGNLVLQSGQQGGTATSAYVSINGVNKQKITGDSTVIYNRIRNSALTTSGIVTNTANGVLGTTQDYGTLSTNQTFTGAKAFGLGAIFYGNSGVLPTSVGDYLALYNSATYGLRLLGFDGTNYKAFSLGARIGTTGSVFSQQFDANGNITFNGVTTARKIKSDSIYNSSNSPVFVSNSYGTDFYKVGTKYMSFRTDSIYTNKINYSVGVVPQLNNTYYSGLVGSAWAGIYSNSLSSGSSAGLILNTNATGYIQYAGANKWSISANGISPTSAGSQAIGTAGNPLTEVYSSRYKSGASDLDISTGGDFRIKMYANGVIVATIDKSSFTLNGISLSMPSNKGILGISDGTNATSGYVGEHIFSKIPTGSAVTMTSGTARNITSITLTPGDWDVSGHVNFSGTGVSTSYGDEWIISISTTSATNSTDGSEVKVPHETTSASAIYCGSTIEPNVINVSANTTVYLVAKEVHSGGTMNAYGSITARRVR